MILLQRYNIFFIFIYFIYFFIILVYRSEEQSDVTYVLMQDFGTVVLSLPVVNRRCDGIDKKRGFLRSAVRRKPLEYLQSAVRKSLLFFLSLVNLIWISRR